MWKKIVLLASLATTLFSVSPFSSMASAEQGNYNGTFVVCSKNAIGHKVYIASSLNNWKTNDPNFELNEMYEDRPECFARTVDLSKVVKNILYYKVVLDGKWDYEQLDANGKILKENNEYWVQPASFQTISIDVPKWKNTPENVLTKIKLNVDEVTLGMDEESVVFVPNSQNGWNPKDTRYQLKRETTGEIQNSAAWTFSFYAPKNKKIEYKFTLGDSWDRVEVKKDGSYRGNRIMYSGINVENRVDRWRTVNTN